MGTFIIRPVRDNQGNDTGRKKTQHYYGGKWHGISLKERNIRFSRKGKR